MPDVGELLGQRYALQTRLAAGGMGEVWCAEDRMLGRQVAVKLPHAADDDSFAQRLLDEARHAASVRHPGIAAVYDVSSEPPVPYLVLELVEGEPLSERLARGRLSPDQTRSLLAQVADALAAAHAAGLVHRDVKPGNLLVTETGTVKVTDFGIARAVDSDTATSTGFVVGTALYLSPEQAGGASAGPASDLYGLGVVAYQCLTGQPPFSGEPLEVLRAHREEPVPPLPDDVPADLRDLVLALLAKDPAERPTAAQVARWAVRERPAATQALPVPTAAHGSRRRRRAPLVGAAAGLVALLLVGVGALVAHRDGGTATGGTAAEPAVVRVASAQLFHPGGSDGDHPAEAPLAVDGDPATAWTTQTYRSADFGQLRPGVGLLLDLGQVRAVREVRVALGSPGLTMSVHAGTAAGDGLLQAPELGRVTGAAEASTITASRPVQARYVVLWVEQLPASGAHRAVVREVSVLG